MLTHVIGLFDAFNIYLGWNYFHPHSCHLANRDHCENKILSYSVFIPGGKYGGTLDLLYGDVYLYFFH